MRSVTSAAAIVLLSFLCLPAALADVVGRSAAPVVSPPLGSLTPADNKADVKFIVKNMEQPRRAGPSGVPTPVDPVVQNGTTAAHSPDVIGMNFDGVGVSNSAPPDTTGRVGKNHFVQWVNTQLAVYDKTGKLLYGPVKGNTLFQTLGGTCATHNDGDPLVQYDILADRWILTQFAVFATDGSFSHQCVAVSMTGDPLGSYYLYDFRTSTDADPALFVDYPHMGVWPDGYYVATHQFGTSTTEQGLYVFDRQRMLAGMPATFQFHGFGESVPGALIYWGALPADLDSLTPPPAGSPEYILQHAGPDIDGALNYGVHVWKVKTTWGATPSLLVTGPVDAAGAPFNGELCTAFLPVTIATSVALGAGARPCVPQPMPAATDANGAPYTPVDYWLDGVSDRLMYRVAYRNFGDHESLVLNHTVNATAHQAGVRWYELRNPGTTPTIVQQSTYTGAAPNVDHRFMGSAAMDNAGNMLVGYTKTSSTLFPEIDVAGRLASDPPGVLGTEILMKASAGTQIGTGNRWGDYSTMTVDPFDGCTFWYTSEYLPAEGQFNWKTRIGTFRYSSCTAPAQGVINGVVTDCVTGAAVSNALVSVSNGFSGATDANGRYSIIVPPGSYTVSASAPLRNCAPSASQSVTVAANGTASRNFCLTGSPKLTFASSTIDDSAASNNGAVNRDECVKLAVSVANVGCSAATGVNATLATSTPGVTVNQPKAAYGTIARDGSKAPATPFSFSTSSADGFRCGVPIDFTLTIASDQGGSTTSFSVPTCPAAAITKNGAITADDAQQAARLGRNSVASSCASTKACPSALGTGNRSFDQYTYANASDVTACVTVNVDADASCSGTNQILASAYLDSYDPQNLCTNYLADAGQSPDAGFHAFSFEVPAGHNFVVVISDVTEGGICPGYTVKVSGLVDNATAGSGACPTPPIVNCLEDNDPQIGYGNGWHLINDAKASGGHFRMQSGKTTGTSASLGFSVPAGSSGAITYNYAKSTSGGSADVYVDNTFRETISFVGAGATRDPSFGFSARYAGLGAGNHTIELRNTKGVAYVDGFCVESAVITSKPASGPGATTSSSATTAPSEGLLQSVALPPGVQSLSIYADNNLGAPMQIILLSPAGAVLGTATSTSGIAAFDVPVTNAGMYIVKTVNLAVGPVSIFTATTPQVAR
ncbi:MAG: hypothetical protein QOE68_702 [Thermoanaerobaculia bacterium]|nr:hypothetical protein [Thermoanaerobaculia bacterium]